MTPIIRLESVTRARAAIFRRYPSSSMAARTRSRVAGRTEAGLLRTRETVWWDTPALLATSTMPGRRPRSWPTAPFSAVAPAAGPQSSSRMAQLKTWDCPTARVTRSVPELKASGGQVMGSTATPRRPRCSPL